jgi:integrase
LKVTKLSTAPAALELQRVQEVTETIEHLTSPKYKRAVQMLFRMITPRICNSRAITVRKGIPKDVRDEYQRLYGQRWEAKLTLPAGMRPQDAKVRISEFSAQVESQIGAIRATQRGEGQSLTQRQAFALAGEWYVWFVARHEENPGTVEQWRIMWDVLIARLEDHAPDWVVEEGWRDLEWTKEPEVRAGMRPLIADECKTAQFLASKGVILNNEAQAAFLHCVLDEFIAAILLLERRANRDYSVDTRLAELPKFDGRKIARSTGKTSPWQLFETWVKARQPAASGVNRWRCVFLDLEQRFESATDVTEDEARGWSRQLVTTKRKARTVNDVWLTAARTVFAWAQEERLITSNPFKDVRVTEPRRVMHRETDAFMPEEWRTILRAASAIGTPKTTFQGAQRWVPWLCAYSGARPGEITQLRGADVQERDRVNVMVLTPDAGTIKTSKVRTVPIHRHLIDEGFLAFVRSRGKGPLFYDPAEQQGSSDPTNPRRPRSVSVRQRLGDWVRKLGVADRELKPNHAWRHTFKQIADRVGISERMSDYITGHAHRTIGAKYGAPTVEHMAAALEKFPRYETA